MKNVEAAMERACFGEEMTKNSIYGLIPFSIGIIFLGIIFSCMRALFPTITFVLGELVLVTFLIKYLVAKR